MTYIATGFAEITCEMTIPGDEGPANVVFGVDGTTLGSATNIDAALQAIFPNAGGWREMYNLDVTLTKATTRYRSGVSTVEIVESAYSLAGIRGGGMAPPNVATLITKQTGLAGRKNRGRMYMTPLTDGVISTAGIITPADQALVQAGATQFLADLAASSIPMVILHTSPADTPTPVNSLVVASKVATQRRRLR